MSPDPPSTPLTVHRDATRSRRSGLGRGVIALDEAISWACSGKGWNCCVDKTIPVRPYDIVRLRHAASMSSRDLVDREVVTFDWDGFGILTGWLAQRPYAGNRTACVFYEELTVSTARRIRDTDPERFRALPPDVRDAATAQEGDSRIAGLCNAHTGRPEACRGFPIQRDPTWHDHPERAAARVFDCGSCALAEQTTPREIMLDNDLTEFWRADDAYRAVAQYLHKMGLANLNNSAYRRLPVEPQQRAALWTALYIPDANPGVRAMAGPDGEQWQSPLDIEGDREVIRHVFRAALDAADGLIEASGIPRDRLGGPGDPIPRPDLDTLLDPARPVLPPRE